MTDTVASKKKVQSDEYSFKERELLEKLDIITQQLKEKDTTIERKVEESFNLKKIIDTQKTELTKTKQALERAEDKMINKDLEIKQLKEDIEASRKKKGDDGQRDLIN